MLVTIAASLIVLVVGGALFMAVVGNPFIDWMDARTSRLTHSEATHRARLANIRQWPLRTQPWRTRREWIVLTVGLLLIALATSLYRYLSR